MQLNHDRVGSGTPLVLIHGIGSRWQVFKPVLQGLAQEREVVALDLPGFGESPPAPPEFPAGIESLTTLLGDFLTEIGMERPHVAGNSLGGWLALELAKRGRARSATCLSPAGFWSPREAIYARVSLWTSVRIARVMAPHADVLLAPAAARRASFSQYAAHPERITPEEAAASVRALANAQWFDETLIASTSQTFRGGERIEVPVTVAWGERDRLLLPRQARRALRAIPAARVITLRDCGHVPTYDDAEQVTEVLLEGSKS